MTLLSIHIFFFFYRSKKGNTERNKRLSLTDVSTLSCPSIKSLKINKIISKNFNSKLNSSSEKPPSRRKKVLGSDKGSDKYDSACSNSQRESSSKDDPDLLKPVISSVRVSWLRTYLYFLLKLAVLKFSHTTSNDMGCSGFVKLNE